LIIGGDFTRFYGKDAWNMGHFVDSTSFDDGRNPFGYANNTNASPSGSIGPVAGAYIHFDWNDYIFTNIEVVYLWKGDEYQKILPAAETYCYWKVNGDDCVRGQEAVDSISAEQVASGGDATVEDGFRRWVMNRSYVEVPVMLGVNISRELNVFVGPHASVLVGSSFQAHITESSSKNALGELFSDKQSYTGIDVPIKRFDYGFTAGLGYHLTEQFELSFRWAPGYWNVLDKAKTLEIKSNCFQMLASLNFSDF
jgi:hypothetical protein